MMLSHSLGFPPRVLILNSCSSHKPCSCIRNNPPLIFPSVSTSRCHASLPANGVNHPTEKLEELKMSFERELPLGLQREYMPNHVAVVMDGNSRWAKQRNLPTWSGHKAMLVALTQLYKQCCRFRIPVLTVFAFSTENWNRPQMEVEFLMSLFERYITVELDNFIRDGVRFSLLGDASKLPQSLQRVIVHAREKTKNNSRLQLILAISYSGQYDIMQACQNIAHKVRGGLIQPEDIDKSLIEQHLQTNCAVWPRPDLLIRTGGELRLSNFLLWDLAYTQLLFVKSFWPDFGEVEFVEALHSFQRIGIKS